VSRMSSARVGPKGPVGTLGKSSRAASSRASPNPTRLAGVAVVDAGHDSQ